MGSLVCTAFGAERFDGDRTCDELDALDRAETDVHLKLGRHPDGRLICSTATGAPFNCPSQACCISQSLSRWSPSCVNYVPWNCTNQLGGFVGTCPGFETAPCGNCFSPDGAVIGSTCDFAPWGTCCSPSSGVCGTRDCRIERQDFCNGLGETWRRHRDCDLPCDVGLKPCCFCSHDGRWFPFCEMLSKDQCEGLGGRSGSASSCVTQICEALTDCGRFSFGMAVEQLGDAEQEVDGGDHVIRSVLPIEINRPQWPNIPSDFLNHYGIVSGGTFSAGIEAILGDDFGGGICIQVNIFPSSNKRYACPVVSQGSISDEDSRMRLTPEVPDGDFVFECPYECPCDINPC